MNEDLTVLIIMFLLIFILFGAILLMVNDSRKRPVEVNVSSDDHKEQNKIVDTEEKSVSVKHFKPCKINIDLKKAFNKLNISFYKICALLLIILQSVIIFLLISINMTISDIPSRIDIPEHTDYTCEIYDLLDRYLR